MTEPRALLDEVVLMAEAAADIYRSLSFVRGRLVELGITPGPELDRAVGDSILAMESAVTAAESLKLILAMRRAAAGAMPAAAARMAA